MREFILGGQKSGKSRTAESRAGEWLAAPGRAAVLIATAQPGDAEMAARIARHRSDRVARVPGLSTVEEPVQLAAAIARLSQPQTMVVVDCLTLWLTQLALPLAGEPATDAELEIARADLGRALIAAPGPVVLVSNEIGLGLSPLSPEARRFVDALGRLHQEVAAACERVTLMVAGCELPIKRGCDAV
ncbi:MAG: bifunctional adenosylcobinamide kinase/adenosylcobinamide-phosphate guanylyltransferase [Burkholderiaceae bacterium]